MKTTTGFVEITKEEKKEKEKKIDKSISKFNDKKTALENLAKALSEKQTKNRIIPDK